MRLASLVPVRLAALTALTSLTVATGACIIVIEDDDDDPRPPPWRPDGGPDARPWDPPLVDALLDGQWAEVDAGIDARTRIDGGIVDGGSGAVLTIDTACGPAPATLQPRALDIRGNIASITVEHGGGCGDHAYRVCWDGTFESGRPPQVNLELQHRSNDPCDAIVRQSLRIDLSRLRDAFQSPTVVVVGFGFGSLTDRYEF